MKTNFPPLKKKEDFTTNKQYDDYIIRERWRRLNGDDVEYPGRKLAGDYPPEVASQRALRYFGLLPEKEDKKPKAKKKEKPCPK